MGRIVREKRVEPGHVGHIYVLCFCDHDRNKSRYKHTEHYIGWSSEVIKRINYHRKKSGAKITRALIKSGLDFRVTSIRRGTRADERKLKRQKNNRRFCNVCKTNSKRIKNVH